MPDVPCAAPAASRPDRAIRKIDLLLIAVFGALLFLPFLGLREVWTSGEARVAQVARQMRQSGDWLKPVLGDEERLQKPPLAYWLAGLASLPWRDVDDFNSRLPNALAGLGVLLLIYLLGARLFDRETALWAALMTGSMGEIWWQARTTGIEMPLLFFNLLALYAWWRHAEPVAGPGPVAGPRRLSGWLVLCYLALAGSFLEKGPVGPPLVALIIVAYLTVAGRWREPRPGAAAGHAAGVLGFLLLALPWFAFILWREPQAWDVWFHQSAGRFKGFDHIKDPFYFCLKILGDGQPWVILGVLAPFFMLRSPLTPEERKRFWLPAVWAGVTLIFFSIPASKKSYYILPIYPALALLASSWLSQAQRQAGGAWLLRHLLTAAGGALFVAGLAAWPLYELLVKNVDKYRFYQGQEGFLLPTAAAAAAMGGLLFHFARQRQFHRAAGAVLGGAVFFYGLYVALTPDLNRHKGDKFLCDWLVAHGLRAEDRIYTYYMAGSPILMYYLDRPVDRIGLEPEVLQKVKEPGPGRRFVMMKDDDFASLGPELRGRLKRLDHPEMPDGSLWTVAPEPGAGASSLAGLPFRDDP